MLKDIIEERTNYILSCGSKQIIHPALGLEYAFREDKLKTLIAETAQIVAREVLRKAIEKVGGLGIKYSGEFGVGFYSAQEWVIIELKSLEEELSAI